MKILFSLLSCFYVASIFTLAGSPLARKLSEFNPYSLLHIPLYGILAVLFLLSMVPIPRRLKVGSLEPGGGPARLRSGGAAGLTVRLFVAGGIALVVGIFDEIHQLSVPGREGSAGDVVLDAVGIAIALLLFFRFFKTRFHNKHTTQ